MLRTAYFDATQADLTTQLQHAMRDRCTALVYGPTRCSTRLAAAILTTETTIGRPLHVTRQHDRWVIHR
jgi:hypothetical protein